MLRFACVTMILLLYVKGSLSQLNVCGQVFSNSRIVGGMNAKSGAWPWQVSLEEKGEHFCGGTLINKDWVMTAAHCVTSTSDGMVVVLGKLNLRGSNPKQIFRGVTQAIHHPKYNSDTENNDIALLRLNASVTFTKYIRPVCLATKDSNFDDCTDTVITGWGDTHPGVALSFPDVLQQATVPIVNSQQCDDLLGPQVITKNMICAGLLEGGKDTCQGDSGGPLVIKQGAIWVQAGITSWGNDCAQPNAPGVYTKVSQYQSWISGTIKNNRPGFVKLQAAVKKW